VTTPGYAELVAAIRGEGESLLAAAGQGLDVDVPTCGDWRMPDLLLHIGQIYAHVARLVGERITTEPDAKPPIPDGVEPIAYVAASLDDLVEALASCDADTQVWNWSDQPDEAAFWARRMAHETSVHRFDAQRAHGVAQPLDADLANDGFDELVDVLLSRIVQRDAVQLPAATYSFVATDDGAWHVRLGADGVERLEVAKSPDVTVRGTASALLLAAYSRVPWTSLDVEGDDAALDAWSSALRF
jgi:uncharacterized protein (TIGR03083 family)